MQFFFHDLQTGGIYIIIELIPEHNKVQGTEQSAGIIVGGICH